MILRGPIPSSASDLRLRLFFFPSGELDGRSFCKQTLRCVELFVRSLEGRIAIHSFFCASGNRQIALWRPRSFRGSFFFMRVPWELRDASFTSLLTTMASGGLHLRRCRRYVPRRLHIAGCPRRPGPSPQPPRSERRSSSLNKRGEGSGCSLALQFLAQSESLMADSMLGMQAIDMRLMTRLRLVSH